MAKSVGGMLYEKHAPRTAEECAWSRQKYRELTAWLESRGVICAASAPHAPPRRAAAAIPQALLMYGPSGCGKLAMLRALLQSRCKPVSAVECTIGQLQSHLHDSLSLSKPLSEADVLVVKELPFVGDATRRDLRHVLLQYASSITSTSGLVVFIHTVQDTHSEKVDLYSAYTQQFVEHSCVQKFRCTALTTQNIAARLQAVCAAERTSVSKSFVDGIAESSGGDLRQALLQLQWLCLGSQAQPTPCPAEDNASRTAPSRKRSRSSKLKKTSPTMNQDFLSLLESPTASTVVTAVANQPANGFRRDEYIDVAHAAGRLLMQKYTSEEVLQAVSTTPARLVGYVTNNMESYFGAGQIDNYARCASWASMFDVAAGIESSLLQFSTAALTEPYFHIFTRAYRVHHPHVAPPKGLVPLHPPPVVELAVTRVIEKGSTSNDDGVVSSSSFAAAHRPLSEMKSIPPVLSLLRECDEFVASGMSTVQLRLEIASFVPIILFSRWDYHHEVGMGGSGVDAAPPIPRAEQMGPIAAFFGRSNAAARTSAPKRTIFRNAPAAPKTRAVSQQCVAAAKKYVELSGARGGEAARTFRGTVAQVSLRNEFAESAATAATAQHPSRLSIAASCIDRIEEVSD